MQRECPSRWSLDRLHVGDVTPSEQAQLDRQREDCPDCEETLRARKERFAQLHQHHGFEALLTRETQRHAALTQRKAEEIKQPTVLSWTAWFANWSQWAGLATVGGLAVFLLFLRPPSELPPDPHNPPKQEGMTFQGKKPKTLQPHFRALFYRKGSPYSRWFHNGQVLFPGDLIQFSYKTFVSYHVMIVGCNKRGESYVIVPFQGKRSVKIQAGKGKLPNTDSLELDDYIGPERFFFLYARRAFSFQDVERALKKAYLQANKDLRDMHTLQGSWQVFSLLVHKRPAHSPSMSPQQP